MKLYFLRHGAAEERRPDLPDADRRLTPEGIEEMRRVSAGLAALGLRLDAVLTSPLARARETAEMAAEALGLQDRVRIEKRLASGARPGDLQAALEDQPGNARLLLVGHEPDFSTLISTLIGGGRLRMKKAGVACVDLDRVEPGAGELRWLMEPGQLAQVG